MTYENGIYRVFIGLLILWAFSYGLFFHAIPTIDQWERVNDYPLGLHCEFWNVCDSAKGLRK